MEQNQIQNQAPAYDATGRQQARQEGNAPVAQGYAPPQAVSMMDKLYYYGDKIKWFTDTFLSRISKPVDTIYQVGVQRFREGEIADATLRFRFTVRFRPHHMEAWYLLGTCELANGRSAEAVAAFRQVLALNPQHEEARFLLASLAPHLIGQGEQPRFSPLRLVTEHFNGVAHIFDEEQLDVLGYYGHIMTYESLIRYIDRNDPNNRNLTLLDLGCGTGLVGVELRDLAARIEGVDVSGNMLAYAESRRDEQARRIYDYLHLKDLRLFLLEQYPSSFDLITAANVFPSVGGLTPVFDGIVHCLKPGGLVSFSVEPYTGSDFGLIPNAGRFGHSDNYIQEQAARVGLEVLERTSFEIYRRQEAVQYVLRKPGLVQQEVLAASPNAPDTAV